jgi:hypothetical protein
MRVYYNDGTITVTSETLGLEDIAGVALSAQIDCTGTPVTYTVPSYDNNTFDVDVEELFDVEVIPQGVISFVLSTSFDNEQVTKEYTCFFSEGSLVCDIADCVKENPSIELQLDFYLLSRSNADGGCGCDCVDLCTIYKRLLSGIENCTSC